MVKKILITVVAVICMSNSCRKDSENCHYRIFVTNTSNDAIYVSVSFKYPDTTIQNPDPRLDPNFSKLNIGQTAAPFSRGSCIEGIFPVEISSGILQLFVFKASRIDGLPWDTIKKNYLIEKRYELTLQDLKDRDFTLTYP